MNPVPIEETKGGVSAELVTVSDLKLPATKSNPKVVFILMTQLPEGN